MELEGCQGGRSGRNRVTYQFRTTTTFCICLFGAGLARGESWPVVFHHEDTGSYPRGQKQCVVTTALTLSLLAGIDLLTGKVHACVENRHRSREFVGFLKKIDAAYSTETAIKLILDNHSAHISKETKTWLAAQPEGRFTFVFTPKHGSWLNLVEGFFSKMARSVLRRIRVASKDELKARILAYLDDLNREPVIHTWTYKLDAVA